MANRKKKITDAVGKTVKENKITAAELKKKIENKLFLR